MSHELACWTRCSSGMDLSPGSTSDCICCAICRATLPPSLSLPLPAMIDLAVHQSFDPKTNGRRHNQRSWRVPVLLILHQTSQAQHVLRNRSSARPEGSKLAKPMELDPQQSQQPTTKPRPAHQSVLGKLAQQQAPQKGVRLHLDRI